MRGLRARVLLAASATAIAFGGASIGSAPAAVAAGTISPTPLSNAPAHTGEPYFAGLTYTGVPTWSIASGRLPPGLTLTAGMISGVPTLAGAYTFIVRADDAGNVATKAYTIRVSPPTSTNYDTRV